MSLRWTVCATVSLLAACAEPTRPPAARPTSAPDQPEEAPFLSQLASAWASEADRLLPAIGQAAAEQPLRLALRRVREGIAADQAASIVDEARGLLESYQRQQPGELDPAEVDAVALLITGIDETVNADRAVPEHPALTKRRPS